ncbi:hypothetical protein ACQEWB_10295 [Streptomyces sp. CA-249302]|uniref:hypothetical protein n=1 Tax=Streptomyces sp. CA-249302 TaxID=3240058 RepID=UPI003D906E6F
MPPSVLLLDVHVASVTAELELPLNDLSRASGIGLDDGSTAKRLAARKAAIRRYLTAPCAPPPFRARLGPSPSVTSH